MIEFIKEYGITTIDYEYIIHNVDKGIIQNIAILFTQQFFMAFIIIQKNIVMVFKL